MKKNIRQSGKTGIKNQTHITFKRRLLKERGKWCEGCKKNFAQRLDHIIPISISGDNYSENNLQLLCKECDKRKTRTDLSIIQLFLNLRFLIKTWVNEWELQIDKNTLINLYKQIFELKKELILDDWYYDKNSLQSWKNNPI